MLSAIAARKAAQLAATAQADLSTPDVTTETKKDSIDEQIGSQSPLNNSDSAVDGRKRRASGPITDSPGQKETRKRHKGSQTPLHVDSGRSQNGLSEDISGDAEGSWAKAKPSRRRKKGKRYFEEETNFATPISQNESDSHRLGKGGSSSEDELFGLHLLPGSGNSSNGVPLTPKPPSDRIQRAWSPSNPLRDSSPSDDELVTKSTELLPSSAPPIFASPLSNWTPTPENCYDLPATYSAPSKLFLLQPEDAITLLGVFAFTVLKGGIEYQGTQLSPSPRAIEVFAPRCAPLSALQAIPLDHHRPDKIVNGEELLPAEFRDRVANHNGSALLLSSLRTGIEGLGKVCQTFEDVFSPPRVYGGVVSLGLDGVVMVKDAHPQLQPFLVLPSWRHSVESIMFLDASEWSTKPPIFLTRGAKGTGKSSFTQMLSFNLLRRYRRVAILDVDPGQPLLSAPGLLSLHIIRRPRFAPPFANCSTAAKAHYFGGVTPRSSVERWEEIVQDLIQTWRLDWAYSPLEESPEDIEDNDIELIGTVIPLVVNTHGWVKGYGAELQRKLELMTEPTHIFTLAEPNSQNTDFFESQETGLSAALQYQLQPLPPSPLSSRFTANDLRSISILSYFHLIPNSQDLDTRAVPTVIWDTSRALCDTPPWKVSYGENKAITHVYLTGPWADGVVPSEIAGVMDCAVVGLMASEEDIPSSPRQDDEPSDGVPIPYTQGEDPPAPEYSRCLGLALIRAVDTSSGNFHILTPVEPRLLPSCRVVLKGDLTLPIWGFLRFGEAPAGETPYIDWGTARGVRGGEKKRIRRNLMRKGQM